MADQVLGITEARASLPTLVDRLVDRSLDHVVIGSHRKPEAVIVPFGDYRPAAPDRGPMLATVRERADLVRRIAGMSNIVAVAVFGSVARVEERADSDIDFLVDAAPGASMFDLARFQGDMELLFDRHVDVVERAALDPQRDRAMLADAVQL